MCVCVCVCLCVCVCVCVNKLSMVNNLLIARKTYRPREGVGMFIIKKMYIFERLVSSGSYQAVNAERYLKGGM